MRALLCVVSFGSAASETGQTDTSQMLNGRIAWSSSGVYRGGDNKGVMVRSPDFFDDGSDNQVLPATFWHNDIYSPSQMYPTVSSPWCPNDGSDGFYDTSSCSSGPWHFATVAVVMAGAMEEMWDSFDEIQNDDWGNGVFYASDANAADGRCVYRQEYSGWDCPGGWVDLDSGYFSADSEHHGAGAYAAGNPDAKGFAEGGGGSGCHFDRNAGAIDQPDAYDGSMGNLVSDANCQCNYAYSGNWGDWVTAWTYHSQQKSGFENRDWLNGGGNLAPTWAVDIAACWVNNPRDMINLQNALYWQRDQWNNQFVPRSDWSQGTSEEVRKYWGWNEIPVGKWIVDNPQQWDALIIKLPADACQRGDWGRDDQPDCLADDAKWQVEQDLDNFKNAGKLVPGSDYIGSRPGSYILFVREVADDSLNWHREFFCSDWTSPNNMYKVVYANPGQDSACYIDYASSPPAPTPLPPPPATTSAPQPDPPAPPAADASIIKHDASDLCLDLSGDFHHPDTVIVSQCSNDSPQWFLRDGQLVYAGLPNSQKSDIEFCAGYYREEPGQHSVHLQSCEFWSFAFGPMSWEYNDGQLRPDGNAQECLTLERDHNHEPVVQVQSCSDSSDIIPKQQWIFGGQTFALHNVSAAAAPWMTV